jgi:transposase InsO family protein
MAHRRLERVPHKRSKPRPLTARQPDQIYCWDITYLPTQVRGDYFYLYLFVDLFSRKIVGWQVFDSESAQRASDLLKDICARQGIAPGQLVVHSDNGSPMRGETMLATMQRLGVAPSRSRPSVSNDNPYSEALFRTLKYRPDLPVTPFESLLQARRWASEPQSPGVVHVMDPTPYEFSFGKTDEERCKNHLVYLEETIKYEGPHTIAAMIVETVNMAFDDL